MTSGDQPVSSRKRRALHTKAGEVTLKMPKLRSVPFETAIIERYRRRESSVQEALMEMYLAGVSVRRVEDITEALWGMKVSAGTVSDLNQKMNKRIEKWRNRKIEGHYPYVYLDGICLKRKGFPMALSEFAGAKAPYFLENINVVARNLSQARVLHTMLTAAIMVPPRRIIGLSDRGCRARDHHCDCQANDGLIHWQVPQKFFCCRQWILL